MMLRPFFSFYGGKWRAAPHYPTPVYDTIVEPFAGAAGYSMRYAHLNVVLYDADPVIAGIWDYLIHVSEQEILALPTVVSHVDDLCIAQEARHLIGFWLNTGSSTPCKTPSAWMRAGTRVTSYWGEAVRGSVARQVQYIRHWRIFQADYAEAENRPATWFVDPPYVVWGHRYRHHNVDYKHLANWCQSRNGQVIVCEQEGADWLPFVPCWRTGETAGPKRKPSKEVIFTKVALW